MDNGKVEVSELIEAIEELFEIYIDAIETNKAAINGGISPENMPCVKDDACKGCAEGFLCGLDTAKDP